MVNHSYDGFNRLISSVVGTTAITYSYNAQGIRTSRQVGNTYTDYLLDGGNVVGEITGETVTTYLRGTNLISDGTNYYLYNAHGDVVQLTDSAGAITKTYDYDAFGNEKNPDEDDTNPFRYCGEYYDTATGLYYLRARYYDPTVGRFTQEDTHWNTANMIYGDNPQKINEREDALGLKTYSYAPQILSIMQAGNLYVYCVDNPLFYLDPHGNMAEECTHVDVVDGTGGGGENSGGSLFLILGAISVGAVSLLGAWVDSIREYIAESLSRATSLGQNNNTSHRHHIVAQRAFLARPAANILKEVFPRGVNDKRNFVNVKAPVHQRMHTIPYYLSVNIMILEAYSLANGNQELQELYITSVLQFLRYSIEGLNNLIP